MRKIKKNSSYFVINFSNTFKKRFEMPRRHFYIIFAVLFLQYNWQPKTLLMQLNITSRNTFHEKFIYFIFNIFFLKFPLKCNKPNIFFIANWKNKN